MHVNLWLINNNQPVIFIFTLIKFIFNISKYGLNKRVIFEQEFHADSRNYYICSPCLIFGKDDIDWTHFDIWADGWQRGKIIGWSEDWFENWVGPD